MMRKFIFWFCVTVVAFLWLTLLSIGGWRNLLIGMAVSAFSIIAGASEAYYEMKEKDDAEKDV